LTPPQTDPSDTTDIPKIDESNLRINDNSSLLPTIPEDLNEDS